MKTVCMQLSAQEQQSLEMIMHEIYSTINSVEVLLQDSASITFRTMPGSELDNNINELTGTINTLRMYLEYWQTSSNSDYYAKAVINPNFNIYRLFSKPNPYFKRRMENNKRNLTYSPPDRGTNIPNICGYPTLSFIPNILFDNAIKYSVQDSVISCKMDVDKDDVFIRFTNFAPRLEDDEVDSVFQCGSRGRNAVLMSSRGSGYGLHFLKNIIDAHKGQVDVYSEDEIYYLNGIPYSYFVVEIYLPIILEEDNTYRSNTDMSLNAESRRDYVNIDEGGYLEKI